MQFRDDFPFALRNSRIIYYVYFSNRIMIQLTNIYQVPMAQGTKKVCGQALERGRRLLSWETEELD